MIESVLETPVIPAQRATTMFAQPPMTTIRWATYEFALKLLSPLMLDRMTQEQLVGLITGQKVDYPKDEPLETKALRKMYSDKYKNDMPDGLFVVPRDNVYAMLRDAGEVVQYGSGKNDRITLSTKGTKLYNMIRLHEPFFQILGLDGKPAEWVVDLRKGNATQGSGAVPIIRARFDEGGLVGHVDLNVDLLSEEKMKELFTVGGIYQGLCSGRPAKKMPYGQVALTHLKWIGGADPKKSTARAAMGTKRGFKKTSGDGAPVNRLEEVDSNGPDGNSPAY